MYMSIFNNKNTTKRCEICLKLKIRIPEQLHQHLHPDTDTMRPYQGKKCQ